MTGDSWWRRTVRGSLWGQMLRVGRAAGRASEGGRARFVALLAATVVLLLAGAAFTATTATYDGRQARADARGPSLAQDEGEPATSMWSSTRDSFEGRPFNVILIAPLTAGAPLPPGGAAVAGAG